MKPVKVLEVIRQGQIGGGESHLIDLVNGFRPEEVEPVILAFTPGPMIDSLRTKGLKCYVVETTHPFDIRVFKKIKALLRTEQIRLIHAHGSRAASNVALIARQCNIPLIYTVHGWSFHQDQSHFIHSLRAWSEKLICKLSNRTICVSESNRETGERTFGLKNAQVIENGINLDRFNPDRTFKDIRGELDLRQEDFVVGLIARLTVQKAPLDFVESVFLAHQSDPRIKALIVGEGELKEKVRQYIQEKNASSYIRLSPFRQDIPDLLHALDVFCLPSLWEGLSIALLEAMAMRKALLVTPTDGTRELITHGINGKIIPFSDPVKLAEGYKDYLDHPEQMREYGNAARELVRRRFDSQRVSDEVYRIYKTLC